MGKSRDFRGPRRRGFDDDSFFPDHGFQPRPPQPFGGQRRTPPPVTGPVVGATVKWFNPEKGFGFVALGDGSGDAFLHVGVLQACGRETVAPGAQLQVNVGQGQKGPQVTRVVEVDDSGATEPPRRTLYGMPRGGPRGPRPAPDPATAIEMTGTVKWFNGDKGFGFVGVDDGGKDVFVHASVLARAQLAGLAEGQPVSMRVVATPKGREAISLTLA
jgi:CspA family cold shock protein